MPIYIGNNEKKFDGIKEIWNGNTKVYQGGNPYPTTNMICFEAKASNSSVGFCNSGATHNAYKTINLVYSVDNGANWTSVSLAQGTDLPSITLANVGDKVYFGGTNSNGTGNYYYGTGAGFTCSGNLKVSGNIHKLINYQATTFPTSMSGMGWFIYLFYQCSAITDFTELVIPYRSTKIDCYYGMFNGCTGMVTPPNITLGNYLQNSSCFSMFSGCTSLTTPLSMNGIYSMNASACQYMYCQCTSLTALPVIYCVSFDDSSLGQMFQDCGSTIKLYTTSGTGRVAYSIPTTLDAYDYTSTTLRQMFVGTGGNVSTPTINTQYYTTNSLVS